MLCCLMHMLVLPILQMCTYDLPDGCMIGAIVQKLINLRHHHATIIITTVMVVTMVFAYCKIDNSVTYNTWDVRQHTLRLTMD